jgi:nitroreductase
MDLYDVMRTQSTCRHFRDEQVSEEVLGRVFDAARFAPQGGNRQPVRFVIVRSPELRAELSRLYLELWRPYFAGVVSGKGRAASMPASLVAANAFAENLAAVPVLMVVCARQVLHKRDEGTDRQQIVDGASIYPMVQNVLLACRNEQLGSALTTLLCRRDAEVRAMLGIPDDFTTAALLAVGRPERPFPTKLTRLPVAELVYADSFGVPFGPVSA